MAASQTLEEEVLEAKQKLDDAEISGDEELIDARRTRLGYLERRLQKQQQSGERPCMQPQTY